MIEYYWISKKSRQRDIESKQGNIEKSTFNATRSFIIASLWHLLGPLLLVSINTIAPAFRY